MTADPAELEALTREIRGCFNRLRALGDALHADLGITAATRAVMESLFESGEQTVPDIARAKNVSRQHIQVLFNALAKDGLASTRPNPADRRSPLVSLTRRGEKVFARMRRREKRLLAEMTAALAGTSIAAAVATLRELRADLDRRLAGADTREIPHGRGERVR